MKGTLSRCENRTEELAGGARKVNRLLALAEEPSEGSSSVLDKISEMAWLAVTQLLAGDLRECLPRLGLAKASPMGHSSCLSRHTAAVGSFPFFLE